MVVTGGSGVVGGSSGGGVANSIRPPWLAQDPVAIHGVQHDLPKNMEKFLPKFDLNNKEETPKN